MGLHKDVAEDNMHEPKGFSTLTAGAADIGKVTASDGAGGSTARKIKPSELDATEKQSRMGLWDYNDLATATAPIILTPVSTFVKLTNDEAGPFTNKTYKLDEVTDLWNKTTNQFDFTELSLGDVVDFRFDFTVTTTGANHELEFQVDVGIGDAGNHQITVHRENFKSAGTYSVVKMFSMYMGDTTTKDFPTEIKAKSDTGATDDVIVNGWFVEATTHATY